jgi:hypothetical protein
LTGYITLERAIFNHPSLNKSNRQFCEITAFIWLLTEASFKDRIYRIYEQEIELKRGQLCCSLTYMAEAWNWEVSKVRYFIDKLRQHSTLTSHKPNNTPKHIPNILTICNYDEYQHTPDSTTISTTNSKKQNKGKNTLKNKLYRDNFDVFWSKVNRKISKGQSERAYSKLAEEWGSKPEALAELYNKHCSSVNEIQFSQHPSTWLNAQGYLDQEVTSKPTTTDNFGIQPKEDDEYLKWVRFVQKGMRSTKISDDMVVKMRKEGLITEEQFKAW